MEQTRFLTISQHFLIETLTFSSPILKVRLDSCADSATTITRASSAIIIGSFGSLWKPTKDLSRELKETGDSRLVVNLHSDVLCHATGTFLAWCPVDRRP